MKGSALGAALEWKGTPRYDVLGCLGQGGMGVVYEAFDRERRQRIALKKLLHYDPAALYLFKQEFRTLADVRHTNLVHLYELVVDGEDDVFFTMELVRGVDFLQYAKRSTASKAPEPDEATTAHASATLVTVGPRTGPRAIDEAQSAWPPQAPQRTPESPSDMDRLRLALRQLVEGIHVLHAAGKLHRDVKPSNVLVTAEGRVVLLDFGVAADLRLPAGDVPAASNTIVGTARYMAPEQADGSAPFAASDWYSVGVMIYEALVGHPPFSGSRTEVLAMKSMMEARAPSEFLSGAIPPDLDALCVALLRRDPALRPVGAEILKRLGDKPGSSAPPHLTGSLPPDTFLVGRDATLRALRSAYDATRHGRTVTVRVGGAAGMGKSTVVHHFLDQLAQDPMALVLRGRAYERETVPYKAVDGMVDSLSQHLLRASEAGTPHPLPEGAPLLARLFPVLQRVPEIVRPSVSEVDDERDARRLAFRALRDLLASLAQSRPVVLFVDDAHWGDVDSAALLLDILRPPGAPAVLLIMTFRDNEEEASPFLTELNERWPADADLRNLTVDPLATEEAQLVAMTLLDATDEHASRTARAVALESGGSPFLVGELVRSNRGAPDAVEGTAAPLMLHELIAERLARLPEPARRFTELVAVGGRPLQVAAVALAAEVDGPVNDVVGLLCARRFLRTGLRGGAEVVEITHDRIRETIVARLPPETAQDHHGRLARVLQEAPGADAEAVALHWLGAGDTERAARFAEGAAEQAASKLAIDQAARLYRLALEHLPPASPEKQRLRARLAEALRDAGRRQESARAYLAAAEGAPPSQQLEFQRAAAEQLLFGGHLDEGRDILYRLLPAVGMRAPQSAVSAVLWLLLYRVWLAILGLRFQDRARDEVSAEQRLRIDALATVALGFAVFDVILATCMQARHLIEALRAGDRFQVARAMAMEAGRVASAGGRESARELALVQIATSLAEREGSAEARAFFAGLWGVGLFMRGRWRQARELFDEASQLPHVQGYEVTRLFAIQTRTWMGEMGESWRLMSRLSASAEDRGDLYTLVSIRTSTGVMANLAAGDPARARRELESALAQWPHSGFHVQHWTAMVFGAHIDLYLGEPERAYQRFIATLPALKRSLLLGATFTRVMTWYVHGKLAIACIKAVPQQKAARIAESRTMVRRLDREHDRWAGVTARILEASVENAAGNRDAAIAALRAGIAGVEGTETHLYSAALRYRLGELLGGDEGAELMTLSSESLAEQGIRDPRRWVELYLPGTWSTS